MAEQNDWGAHLSTVGAFIREQRRLVKLSQRQLANATGLSDTYLSQLERGLHEPSLRALRAIAKGLNVSAEQLISLTGAIEDELQPDGAGDGEGVPTGTAPVTSEAAIRQDPRLSEAQKTALLAVLGSYLAANDGGDATGGDAQSSGRTGNRSGRSSSARKSPTTRAV